MSKTRVFSMSEVRKAAELSKEHGVEIELRADGSIVVRPYPEVLVKGGVAKEQTLEEWLIENGK